MAKRNQSQKSERSTPRPPGNDRAAARNRKRARQRTRPEEPRATAEPMANVRRIAARERRAATAAQRRAATPVARLRTGITAVGRGLTTTGTRAVETVTANPVPAILIGAGLAWLLADRVGRRSQFLSRAGETIEDVAGRVGSTLSETAETVKEGVTGAAETVRERAGRIGEVAQTGLSAVRETLRAGATAVGQGAKRTIESGRQAVAETWTNHPLSMGLATLAAGLAAGLLLPRTRREQEMMGPRAAQVAQRVRTTGREMMQRGKQAASAAVDATTREARRVGLAPQELGRKLKRVATSAREAATGTRS